jgi:transposase-like protein
MAMEDTGNQQTAVRRPDKRRRFSHEQRQALVEEAQVLRKSGLAWADISGRLGVGYHQLRKWRNRRDRLQGEGCFAAVVVASERDETTISDSVKRSEREIELPCITVFTPSGYRIEGLSVADITGLLRVMR